MAEYFDPLAGPFRIDGDTGEAVVLVHGFTGTPAHWRLMAPVLAAAGYTVEIPLLAGHGTSVDDLAATRASDWLASVHAALDSVGDHRRVHLVGLSMGGLLSVVAAAERDVASITTINSPVRYRNRQTYLAPLLWPFRPRVAWPEAPAPDLDAEAESLWLTYDMFGTRQLGDVVRLGGQARRAASAVDAPALVIQSLTDESVAPVSASILSKSFAGPCRIVWLERSLHNALLDRMRSVVHAEVLNHLGATASDHDLDAGPEFGG